MPLVGVKVVGVEVAAETFKVVGAVEEVPVAEEVPAGVVVDTKGSSSQDLLCGLGLTSSTAGHLTLVGVRSKSTVGDSTSVRALEEPGEVVRSHLHHYETHVQLELVGWCKVS